MIDTMEELHRKPPKRLTYLQKALRRRYRFKREEAQHLRRRAHQNAARKAQQARRARRKEKALNQEPKFPGGWSKKTSKNPERWEIMRGPLDKKGLHTYHALRKANEVRFGFKNSKCYYPGASYPSDDNKYFWTRVLRISWKTIFQYVQENLDLDNAPLLQPNLRLYVSAFFSKGIQYYVNPEHIYPCYFENKQDSQKSVWGFYLGGWKYAKYLPDLREADPEEWKRREEKELNEIDRIFAEARQLRIDAVSMKKSLEG